jgi:hypothetical protein
MLLWNMQAMLRRATAAALLLAVALVAASAPADSSCIRLDHYETPKSASSALPQGRSDRAAAIERALADLRANKADIFTTSDAGLINGLRSRLRKEALVILERSRTPEAGLARLEAKFPKLEDITVVHQVPTTREEARALHGDRADSIQRGYLSRLDRELAGASRRRPFVKLAPGAKGRTVSQTLVGRVRNQKPNEMLIVLGHIKGGAIQFSDGSALPLADLAAETADGAHGHVWVVGCNTIRSVSAAGQPGIVTTRKLTYSEGIAYIDRLLRAAKKQGRPIKEVLMELQMSPENDALMNMVGVLVDNCSEGAREFTVSAAGNVMLFEAMEEE